MRAGQEPGREGVPLMLEYDRTKAAPADKKPWSTPHVILSDETRHTALTSPGTVCDFSLIATKKTAS